MTSANSLAGTRKPSSVIRIGVAMERHAGCGQTVGALTCLPALVGAWRSVGGGILQMPIWAFPMKWEVLMRPDWIKPGTSKHIDFQRTAKPPGRHRRRRSKSPTSVSAV